MLADTFVGIMHNCSNIDRVKVFDVGGTIWIFCTPAARFEDQGGLDERWFGIAVHGLDIAIGIVSFFSFNSFVRLQVGKRGITFYAWLYIQYIWVIDFKSQLRATCIILDSKGKDPSEITLHIHRSDSLMIIVIENSKMVKTS